MSASSEHQKSYKNKGKALEASELRRKREEEGTQLRKHKRDEQLSKRRNIDKDDPSLHGPEALLSSANADDVMCQSPPFQLPLSRISSKELEALDLDGSPAQLFCIQRFRKLVSKDSNPLIDEVIKCGVVPKFVELLSTSSHREVQFEAAWTLTNIASGNSEQTQAIVDSGAIPVLVSLLSCDYTDLQEQAIWALGNIAGDTAQFRDLVTQSGILSPLFTLLKHPDKEAVQRNSAWCLSNLCRGKEPLPDFSVMRQCLPVLASLLYSQDWHIVADACWALSYIADGPNERIQAVVDTGVCRRLVELLMNSQQSVVSASLRAVGNVVTGEDLQTQVVINCSALPCLLHLLNNSKELVRREACWTLSNITAGNRHQIQAVIDTNIVPRLIVTLNNAEYRTRKEAAWAIANITTGGSPDQMKYLVDIGSLTPLCNLLTLNDPDAVTVALSALENILRLGRQEATKNGNSAQDNPYTQLVEECNGLDKLEFLQCHQQREIYERAYRIIDEYFSHDVDASVSPTVDPNTARYQFNTVATSVADGHNNLQSDSFNF